LTAACVTAGTVVMGQPDAPPGLAWQAVRHGPIGGSIEDLAETSAGVLVATERGGIFHRSTDDGLAWIDCRRLAPPSARQPGEPASQRRWEPLVAFGGGEALITDTRCESFASLAMPNRIAQRPAAVLPAGTNVLALYSGAAYLTEDSGRTWREVLSFPPGPVCGTSTDRGQLIVTTERVYRTTGDGVKPALTADRPCWRRARHRRTFRPSDN
jgi:hypothetical protein